MVAPASARTGRRELLAWSLAIVGALVALGALALFSREAPSTARPVRFSFHPPGFRYERSFDIVSVSPDGEKLAFIAENEQGSLLLWVRPITESTATPLVGTEGAEHPFWSPDESTIAFRARDGLFTVPAAGGPVQTLVPAGQLPDGFGGSWSASGTILVGGLGGLLRLDAGGGIPVAVPESVAFANWPYFLPDGRHFLYLGVIQEGEGAGALNLGIFVASLDAVSERRLLLPVSSRPLFMDDHLLYVRDSILMAQPFDLDSLVLTGDAAPVADGVFYFESHGGNSVSGGGGVLCYVIRRPARPYVWLGRSGEPMGTLGESSYYGPATLSPDGRRAAVSVTSPRSGTQDLYLIDIARETATRLTREESSESEPVWSPDGQKVAFFSDRDGPPDIYIMDVASGTEKLLWSAPGVQIPRAWSPDGSEILMTDRADPERNFWLVPVSSESKAVPLAPPVSRAPDSASASFSPDGRWLAFESSESGRTEIYVQPFRRAGAKVRLSRSGGSRPRWRRDGRELFFQSGQSLVAVSVEAGASFASGPPETLFTLDQRFSLQDVTGDGERFLLTVEPRPHEWQPIEVMVEREELKRLVPN
jgi:Tol biopolymer transport system component